VLKIIVLSKIDTFLHDIEVLEGPKNVILEYFDVAWPANDVLLCTSP
jgi:hypothetical protein